LGITNGETTWGVTVLEAADEFDAGAVWASYEFELDGEPLSKSSLYRGLVTEAAVQGVIDAVARVESGECFFGSLPPETQTFGDVRGCLRPLMRQADRAIDWTRDTTAEIARKIRAADSAPGVLGTVLGRSCYFFGAHEEERLQGPPGEVLARRDGAICIGTVDGALWISHLKAKGFSGNGHENFASENTLVPGINLPATEVLGSLLFGVPEVPLAIDAPADHRTFREIVYIFRSISTTGR
jgi:putative two-component system hydrogenase maturation factor HypX/HoxX